MTDPGNLDRPAPEDESSAYDPIFTPPETDNPWDYLRWARGITLEERHQFFQPWAALVAALPSWAEQEALMGEGREVFRAKVDTIRDLVRDLRPRRRVEFVPTISGEGWLAEMIYRPETDPKFGFLMVRLENPAAPEFMESIEVGAVQYWPLKTKLVEQGAVVVPSGVEEYGDDEQLWWALREFLGSYVQADAALLDQATAYARYTWVYDRLPLAPYFAITGDFAAGKSTLLDTLGHICYRAVFAAGAATAAPIYRVVDKLHGTLVFDEFDYDPRDPEWKQILKILNQGWKPGQLVLRAERAGEGEPFEVTGYQCFGPKIFASRSMLPDAALRSRCLAGRMMPVDRLKASTPLFADPAYGARVARLQRQLLLWRFRTYALVQADPYARPPGIRSPRVAANALMLLAANAVPRAVQEGLLASFRDVGEGIEEDRRSSDLGLVVQAIVALRALASNGSPRPPDRLRHTAIAVWCSRATGRTWTGKTLRWKLVDLGLKTDKIGGDSYVIGLRDETVSRLVEVYGERPPDSGSPPRRVPMSPPEPRPPTRRAHWAMPRIKQLGIYAMPSSEETGISLSPTGTRGIYTFRYLGCLGCLGLWCPGAKGNVGGDPRTSRASGILLLVSHRRRHPRPLRHPIVAFPLTRPLVLHRTARFSMPKARHRARHLGMRGAPPDA